MNDERHDLNEFLRAHGSAPDHLPGFQARLLTGLDEADREMGRAAGGRLRWPRGSRSLWSRHPVLASAAAVGIAAVVVMAVLVGVPGVSRLSGPQPVSAAQVIQKALDALSSGKTMQADATLKEETAVILPSSVPEFNVSHSRVLLRSDGSFRQTQTDKAQTSKPVQMRDRADAADTAYDAASGVFRDYSRGWDWDAGGYVNRVEVTTGYPLGPPDRWANEQFDISATARALQADGAAKLETASYDGRPVWVVSGSKHAAAPGLSDDETYSITIDQQTCLPTRVQMFAGGVLQLDYSLHNVRIDEPLPDTAFSFAPPKGAKVVPKDARFRRVPLATIASTPGRVVLLPTWLPAGYVQSWTAAAARSTTANGVTDGRDVVALQYVRGFDALTVTTRIVADPHAAATIDPVEPDTSWADLVSRDVRLTAGAFAGVTARVVVASYTTIPHLYAVKDDVLLTVAGGATAKELIAIAESLRPYRPD